MKKILSLLFLFYFLVTDIASASCSSSCSISELEKLRTSHDEEITKTINEYFEKNVPEYLFFSDASAIKNYSDLFIFNTIA